MVKKINSDKLKFNEEKHEYKVGKKKLSSVTEWISDFFPKFDEEKISKKVAEKRIAPLIKEIKQKYLDKYMVEFEEKDWMRDENYLLSYVKEHDELLSKEIEIVLAEWKKSRDDGTAIHEEIENWINGRAEPKTTKGKMGVNWLVLNYENYCDYDDYPEAKIYSEELGLAGTIDLLMIDDSDRYSKPKVTLVDWKSNKQITRQNRWQQTNSEGAISHLHDSSLNKYALQLSVYAYMLEQEYGFLVEDLMIVHLQEDKYVEIRVDYLRETVKEMLREKK